MSLPALMLMLLVGLGAVNAVRTQLECVDAAREVALAVARGGDPDGVAARRVSTTRDMRVNWIFRDGVVVVTVTANVAPMGATVSAFELSATATAVVEPGVDPR